MKTIEVTFGDLNLRKQEELRELMPEAKLEGDTYLFSMQIFGKEDLNTEVEEAMIEKNENPSH